VTHRRLLVAAMSLAAALAGVGAGTFHATPAAGAPVLEIGRAHAEYAPILTGRKPVFILILGSDARSGTPIAEGLCDSIQILGINPKAGRASLVGIPRDSYVSLSTGGLGKINSAMPRGGPQAMVETVEDLTGIRFDYYALTGFDGLTRLLNAVGGLEIDVPYSFVGFELTMFDEGRQMLTGAQALEYTRTRKSLTHGDFDRSMNQGRVLVAAFEQFRSQFEEDASILFRWLAAGLRNVDTDVPLDELIRLAFTASQIGPKGVTNLVAVGGIGTVGDSSTVVLPDPHPMFEDVAADGYVLAQDIPADAQPTG
jgi:LCP family protein required for cell wall assembly